MALFWNREGVVIKIQKAAEVEPAFFAGRDFGSSMDVVRTVLEDVRRRGDEALKEYSAKFDVAAPASFEIPQGELKACADRMKKEKPDLYKALVYSHDLAFRFAKKQKECFTDLKLSWSRDFLRGRKQYRSKEPVYMFLLGGFRCFLLS